jgi:hypothetical protein
MTAYEPTGGPERRLRSPMMVGWSAAARLRLSFVRDKRRCK